MRNRVQDIHDLTTPSDWKFCPGKENPADLHSRGMKLSDLKGSSLHWSGPAWLSRGKDDWPQAKRADQEIEKALPENIISAIEKEAIPKKTLIVKPTNQED